MNTRVQHASCLGFESASYTLLQSSWLVKHMWLSCSVFMTSIYAHKLAEKPCSCLIMIVDETHCMAAGWSEQFVGSVLSGPEFVTNAEYMAPETIRAIQGCPLPNEPAVSPAADIFSLGALLKALLLVGPSFSHAYTLFCMHATCQRFL